MSDKHQIKNLQFKDRPVQVVGVKPRPTSSKRREKYLSWGNASMVSPTIVWGNYTPGRTNSEVITGSSWKIAVKYNTRWYKALWQLKNLLRSLHQRFALVVYWVEGLVLSALRDCLTVASLLHVWNCLSLFCSWYGPLPSPWDLGGTFISLLKEGPLLVVSFVEVV